VQEDLAGAPGHRQPDRRENMLLMAVYAAGGQQTDDVNGATTCGSVVDGGAVRRVGCKAAVFNRVIDARYGLVNDPPRAQAHVADFAVAHLALGQSHVTA